LGIFRDQVVLNLRPFQYERSTKVRQTTVLKSRLFVLDSIMVSFSECRYTFPPPLRIVSNVKVQAWLALFDLKVGDWCFTRILYVLGAIRAQLSELN